MRAAIDLENIDELRQSHGIDDVELHEAIARLRVGDHVFLTFLSGPTCVQPCRCASRASVQGSSAGVWSARSLGQNCSACDRISW